MRQNNLGYCCVDEPHMKGLIPPIAVATAPIAYVRFHGRNAKKWWQHDEAYERYDYEYKPEELQEWVPKIEKLDQTAHNTFVFTNNHYRRRGRAHSRAVEGDAGRTEGERVVHQGRENLRWT